MTCQQRPTFARIATAILCLFQVSACKTLGSTDPCDLSRLEISAEPLAEAGDFKSLYELYLACAQKGLPEAEYTIAYLIGTDADSEILQLDDAQREAEALKWTCRSASHGYEEAIETMADSYYWGWYGLPKDPESEACWRGKLEDPETSMDCECRSD